MGRVEKFIQHGEEYSKNRCFSQNFLIRPFKLYAKKRRENLMQVPNDVYKKPYHI